jgi:hypothetical protein
MTATRNTIGLSRGWVGRRGDRREGRRQRAVRRLLIAADGGPVTTRQMVEAAYPRIDTSKMLPQWRWQDVRLSARRYAEPILQPRSRPLKWRAKPEVFK